jgi:DNA-binding transcriptional LysR family regulator
MELRHLRYFAAVADLLSFRAAAESLNLSTPALSKQVKDLEEEVGVRLLDRDTSHVRLTNAGVVFREETRLILEHAQRAIEQAREADQGRRGRLTIGNVGALTASYMANALTAFSALYPEVELELIDVDIPSQVGAIESGLVELGFLPQQELPKLSAEFETAPVLTAPLSVAMADDHPLAANVSITLKELTEYRVLCAAGLVKPSQHSTYVQAIFSSRGIKLPKIIEVRGFESLLAMVAAGQGVSLLAGRRMVRAEHVQERPLRETGPDVCVDMRAVWRKGARGVLAKNFVDVFRSLDHSRRGAAKRKSV